jgi:hypothetical protein
MKKNAFIATCAGCFFSHNSECTWMLFMNFHKHLFNHSAPVLPFQTESISQNAQSHAQFCANFINESHFDKRAEWVNDTSPLQEEEAINASQDEAREDEDGDKFPQWHRVVSHTLDEEFCAFQLTLIFIVETRPFLSLSLARPLCAILSQPKKSDACCNRLTKYIMSVMMN